MEEVRICCDNNARQEERVASYRKLFKLLIDKNIKKGQLCELAGISTSTLNKLKHGETVKVDMLVKICNALDCEVGDIVGLVDKEEA